MHRTLACALAAAALTLSLAASASAATFCVHQPADPCAAGAIDEGADLVAAADDANALAGTDTIQIGPGTFPLAQPISVSDSAIDGAGQGQTTIVVDPSIGVSAIQAGLTTISDLTLQMNAQSLVAGLDISGNSTASRVTVTGTGNTSTGVLATYGATLEDSTVQMTGPNANAVELDHNGGGAVVRDSVLSSPIGVGVRVKTGGTGTAIVRRVDITAGWGVMELGGTTSVDDSVVRVTNMGGWALDAGCAFGKSSTLLATHVTITGSGNNGGLRSECGAGGLTSQVTAVSSIVRASAVQLRRNATNGGTAHIDISYSDVDLASVQDAGTGAITGGAGNVNVDPLFVSSSDLHLQDGSPVIDAGQPGAPAFATDLDGLARLSGPAVDMGAYEHQVAVPPGGGGGGGGGGGSATPSEPAGTTPAPEQQPGGAPGAGVTPPLALPPAGLVPTRAELRAALADPRPTRRGARYRLTWPGPGTLTIEWRARTGPRAAGATVVARGTRTRTAAGPATVRVRPTAAGRRLLRRGSRPALVAVARFTAADGTTTSARRPLAWRAPRG
ncbi:MAG TPA: choice-of-anchor Q domain-containing protein [Capillimicrobium sp.]|nr:choice-of-anchor Q domain-containing protein [Capillimicrobium sp.]